MTTIGVISHCQITTISSCLEFLLPTARIEQIPITQLRTDEDRELARSRISEWDVLFSIPMFGDYGEFSHDRISDVHPRVIFVPSIDFLGFHPDITYVWKVDGSAQPSPIGDYHSAICAGAHLASLPARRVSGLYNSLIYNKLSYFEEYEASRAVLIDRFKVWSSIDITDSLARWLSRGCFMHSVNHPKSWVIADVLSSVCEREGLIAQPFYDPSDLFSDSLADGPVCPVFPELAARLSVRGSTAFKPPTGNPDRVYSLSEFVERSFAIYEGNDGIDWSRSPAAQRAAEIFKSL